MPLNPEEDACALLQSFDWAASPLGRRDRWPVSLRTLVDVILGASQPMFVVWGAARTLIYNQPYAEILAAKHPAAMGRDFLEVWHEIRGDLTPIVEQAYHGRPVQMDDIELWMERRGYREEAHFSFSYTPVRDDAGAIGGFFCACQEITGQIMAQRDLRESRAMAHAYGERVQLALAAGAIIGTWVWDLPSDRFTVDEAFATAFGLDPALGREGLSLEQVIATVHDDDRAGLIAAIEEVIARGGAYAHQYRVRRADGHYHWIEANGRVDHAEDGTPLNFPGVLLDVEERRRTEAALREETHNLETLNRTGIVIAGELDPERVIQLVTDAAVELSGARYGAFFHNAVDDRGEAMLLYTLSGAERAAFEQFPPPRATPLFQPTFRGEAVIRCDDVRQDARYGGNAPHHGMPEGHLPVRSYLAVPVTSREGEVIGSLLFGHPEPGRFTERHERLVLGIAAQAATAIDKARLFRAAEREIEERRRAEDRLREFNETLEQRVQNEIAERARAEDALRQAQKMEAVGQLTGGIAHDFNNLLTIVTGNVEMATRAIEGSDSASPRALRALGNALKGAERAAALTQRLLAFSRRQPLAPKPLDADRLVAGMSDLIQRSLGETMKLEIVTNPGLWRVEADPNQLESAILNLAVNARDAMPGGGTLTIETANARLDEGYAGEHAVAPGQYVVIAVTDTGVGMSKETLARVFEPFFTTKEVGKGTGLGLSMVYGFTKQSGGHIKVYSEEGHGTTIRIYLPRLLSDAPVEEEKAPAVAERSRGHELILVVEDDDGVRDYTAGCLRELGYRVCEAGDGPSALRLIDAHPEPFDLLFTDVVMPGMTGRDLAEEARLRMPGLKVLYTSGYTRNAIVHGGRLDEGVEMISKPFTYAALAQRIADVLDRGRSGRVLLLADDNGPGFAMAAALADDRLAVDRAGTASEALARVRAARGRYDAVVIAPDAPGRRGAALAAELRAFDTDLPIVVLAQDGDDRAVPPATDRRTVLVPPPHDMARLREALEGLGIAAGQRPD